VNTIPSFFINEELLQFEENTNKSTMTQNIDNDESSDEQFLSFNGVVGNYQIVDDSSSVSFTLGKKNETKGAFKKISGSIEFKEKIDKSTFEINLAMADFTTFNKFRDESLVSEEYFNVDKFPTITFKSNQLTKVDSLNYELTGIFEMLGKKLEEKITLQRVQSNQGIVITGKGKIDRTKYGMTPSATEGNIVTFEYQARLR
jgi:polyisoprenoid-binding protein YceI